jgi:ATP-dependent DNA ligase
MLLLRADSLPAGEQWLYELKLDGYRGHRIQTPRRRQPAVAE